MIHLEGGDFLSRGRVMNYIRRRLNFQDRIFELYGSGCCFYFESYRLTASKSETSIFIAYSTYASKHNKVIFARVYIDETQISYVSRRLIIKRRAISQIIITLYPCKILKIISYRRG